MEPYPSSVPAPYGSTGHGVLQRARMYIPVRLSTGSRPDTTDGEKAVAPGSSIPAVSTGHGVGSA
eukprot:3421581-Rhodomonas_salina.1